MLGLERQKNQRSNCQHTLKVKVNVAQLCPTLCDPMDYIVHGILQARIREWVAFLFSRGSIFPTQGSNPGLSNCKVVFSTIAQSTIALWAPVFYYSAKEICIRDSLIAQSVKNLPAMHETWIRPWFGKIPWRGKGYPLPYSGLENSMDCTVHGVAKSWAWLSDFQ